MSPCKVELGRGWADYVATGTVGTSVGVCLLFFEGDRGLISFFFLALILLVSIVPLFGCLISYMS